MSETPYIYLFVREDLSHPQQIVQTAHAVDSLNIPRGDDTNHMVLIGVKDQDGLSEVALHLYNNGIAHEMFYEPDILAHTAIATVPLKGFERQSLRHFSLKR